MKVTKNQRDQRRPLRQKTESFGRVDGIILEIWAMVNCYLYRVWLGFW